ncbi:threonine--tRNA ligase, partial [Candidatus Microgenomates bacterium]|nr:threonine--tRNA ligase [Candidatus Microgenomates bacterium]
MAKTKNDDEYLNNLRHSCAHLLAAAVIELYPKAKRTIGPSIENGFYYDFDDLKISENDLPKIEQKMHDLVKGWKGFERIELEKNHTLEKYDSSLNNEYKLELLSEHQAKGEQITLYKSGSFTDLCRGGHIKNPSKELQNFKLLKIAG